MKRMGLVMMGCLLMAAPVAAEKTDEAVAAADRWLAVVDAKQYEKSWDEAAEYFKKAIQKPKWIEALQAVRASLGAVTSRQRQSARYTTELPGIRDGEYVVIQYKTAFANKRSAVEIVTPMREADGTWKVSGYYIK